VVWRDSALRDYLTSVWLNSGEDNIFFLASGVAFNILLAAVPFVLLLVSGLGYFLDLTPAASLSRISVLVSQLLPSESGRMASVVTALMNEAIRVRGTVGLLSAITFLWFSTRLFGSLRAVLALVFDRDRDRGIVDGKIFDAKVTVVATLLVVVYTVLNAYIAVATRSSAQLLTQIGVQHAAMGRFIYWSARAFEFVFVVATFTSLYRFLPARPVSVRTAVVAGMFSALLLELAKLAFAAYLRHFNPGSLYTGTLAAIVIVIIWLYYAATIFILGGEVGQVYELRRIRRLQWEAVE
jgi:membrane protein